MRCIECPCGLSLSLSLSLSLCWSIQEQSKLSIVQNEVHHQVQREASWEGLEKNRTWGRRRRNKRGITLTMYFAGRQTKYYLEWNCRRRRRPTHLQSNSKGSKLNRLLLFAITKVFFHFEVDSFFTIPHSNVCHCYLQQSLRLFFSFLFAVKVDSLRLILVF